MPHRKRTEFLFLFSVCGLSVFYVLLISCVLHTLCDIAVVFLPLDDCLWLSCGTQGHSLLCPAGLLLLTLPPACMVTLWENWEQTQCTEACELDSCSAMAQMITWSPRAVFPLDVQVDGWACQFGKASDILDGNCVELIKEELRLCSDPWEVFICWVTKLYPAILGPGFGKDAGICDMVLCCVFSSVLEYKVSFCGLGWAEGRQYVATY